MSEICHECGRTKGCETCGGRGWFWMGGNDYQKTCPDCEHGWQEARVKITDVYTRPKAVTDTLPHGFKLAHSTEPEIIKGDDPDTLCPKCRPSRGFRDSLKDALAQETLDEEAGRN